MFTFQKEPGLHESWLTGVVNAAALATPVFDARMVCGDNEAEVRVLRELLESVFRIWRDEHGTLPDGNYGGLLGNVWAGRPLSECPPYACMGNRFADYAALLAKLTAEQYPPLIELETAANELWKPASSLPDNIPLLPVTATKTGMQRILAALILSEAANGIVESATKAHWALNRIRSKNKQRVDEAMQAHDKMLYRFADVGAKSHLGYKKRDDYQDKADCQAITRPLWVETPNASIADLLRSPEIARYVRKYPDKKTVRGWLSEIDPRPPETKRGRRKS